MSYNSKERIEELQRLAQQLVADSTIDSTNQIAILPLAKQLMANGGCGIDAAKRHIRRAVLGQYVPAGWGGKRPGAGRRKSPALYTIKP